MNLRDLRAELEDEEIHDGRRVIVERELDEILATEPDRDLPMRLCIKAWFQLNTCRTVGMSLGQIPWDKMATWCAFHDEELDREAAMQLIDVIEMLDREFLTREASKRALASATKGQQ